MTTIFAVSSGRPPAGIAVIRISGPDAMAAATALAGILPPSRTARVRVLRGADGGVLDRALVLVFPAPETATGEDVVELHCHGGRAVVAAVERALAGQPGLRPAEAGEFTRRALLNGRIDLAEAEGLADLLTAETERQRRGAIDAAEGRVSQAVRGWMARIAMLSARIEATIDFADEDDVQGDDAVIAAIVKDIDALRDEMESVLAEPAVDRLRDGIRVVIAGPPNAGKSTLINLLAQRQVAIVTPIAGTTRDRIEASVTRDGLPYVFSDTAGLTETDDPVERIGVGRAVEAMDAADILLWLGDDPPPCPAIWIHARADMAGRTTLPLGPALAIAASDARSIDQLWDQVDKAGEMLVPPIGTVAFNRRQQDSSRRAMTALGYRGGDPLIIAEGLRVAAEILAQVLGINATEAMLDSLFGAFCIGK